MSATQPEPPASVPDRPNPASMSRPEGALASDRGAPGLSPCRRFRSTAGNSESPQVHRFGRRQFRPLLGVRRAGSSRLGVVGAGVGDRREGRATPPGKVTAAPLPMDASQQLELDGRPQLGAEQQSSTGTR